MGLFAIFEPRLKNLPFSLKAMARPATVIGVSLFFLILLPAITDPTYSPAPTTSVTFASDSSTAQAPPPPDKVEYTVVTPVKLFQDFKKNPVRAASDYQDKTIKMTGKIKSINKDDLNSRYTVYIYASTDDSWNDVYCSFSLDKADTIKALNVGESVTITGSAPEPGAMGDVELKNCDVVQ